MSPRIDSMYVSGENMRFISFYINITFINDWMMNFPCGTLSLMVVILSLYIYIYIYRERERKSVLWKIHRSAIFESYVDLK